VDTVIDGEALLICYHVQTLDLAAEMFSALFFILFMPVRKIEF